MHLLLLADQDPQTSAIQYRISRGGYTSSCLGAIRFTGKPSPKHLRRAIIKAILRVDAVVVTRVCKDPVQLARVAVICQFAGVPLIDLDNLPEFAPDDVGGLEPYAYQVPVASLGDPPDMERSASQRLLHGLARLFPRAA